MPTSPRLIACSALALLTLAGCASTPPTEFYLLDPGVREVQAEGLEHGLALGVDGEAADDAVPPSIRGAPT